MCRLKHPQLWEYWLAAVVGSFAALEYPAIKHGCHDPLSRTLAKRHLGPILFAGGIALGVHVILYPSSFKEKIP